MLKQAEKVKTLSIKTAGLEGTSFRNADCPRPVVHAVNADIQVVQTLLIVLRSTLYISAPEHGQIRLLKKAATMLDTEKEEKRVERENTLNERVPPLQLSGLSVQQLQDLCKDMHRKIDVIDDERYDIGAKVAKNEKEKILEINSKLKRPNLKRVRISAEAMLNVLLGAKHRESIDFKANLKTVKKEEEKKEEVTDWRKNVEAMSGMEGRKKLFDAGQ
ncbi:hypothetical protein SKAU_G00036220 [Synaphobranchus kaupii]|uniref:Troponin I n=1 Tax=Synaphobranchus kaupii TaxID=118154 RepID=A0A9Q1JH79_SYNKA|nr:hypothetical protein SKAU_G00036220 [Synaphobranchus kaupii]